MPLTTRKVISRYHDGRCKLSDQEIRFMKTAYQDGTCIAEIARLYGVGRDTVYRVLELGKYTKKEAVNAQYDN